MITKRIKDSCEQEYDVKRWVELNDDYEDTYVVGIYKVTNGVADWCADYIESYVDLNNSIKRYDYIIDNFKEFERYL